MTWYSESPPNFPLSGWEEALYDRACHLTWVPFFSGYSARVGELCAMQERIRFIAQTVPDHVMVQRVSSVLLLTDFTGASIWGSLDSGLKKQGGLVC